MNRETRNKYKKGCFINHRIGKKGAYIVVFPETFLQSCPRGFSFGVTVGSLSPEGRKNWLRYWENSVPVPRKQLSWERQHVRLASIS
jgi:hypothetical protein